jgi:hypothetical protein
MANIISRGFGALQRIITRGFSSATSVIFTGPSFNLKSFLDITGESVRGPIDNEGIALQVGQIDGFAVQSSIDPNGQLIRVSLDITGQSLIAAMDNTGIALQGNIQE